MQVSFVIPLYNCLPLTQAMLASLRATIPAGLDHEIILVDDGSTDGTREWLAGCGDGFRVVLNERNLGYGAANNVGAGLARGEQLALLNSDLLLSPHWLEPMLAVQRRLAGRAGIVGNVQCDAGTGAIDHAGVFFDAKGKPAHERAVPWWAWLSRGSWRRAPAVTGACVLVGRALWRELGGFDGRFRNGCEDVDLCLRAAAAGRVNAVALRSRVRHHISASPGRKLRDEENTRRLVLRWRPALLRLGQEALAWEDLASLAAGEPSRSRTLHLCACAAQVGGLRRTAAPRLTAAMGRALDAELARWNDLLGPAER